MLEEGRRVDLVDAERQAHRAGAEGRDRLAELGRGSPVVGGDDGTGIGEEPGGGDAGSGQSEHDDPTPAEVLRGPDRRRGGGHHWTTWSWSMLTRKIVKPSSPASAATIQKRSVIFSSAQPMSSK